LKKIKLLIVYTQTMWFVASSL